ncbi:MAG TPA: SAM-dependent chlorinase/fluorinase [Dissulfurispiraceae bacterium]
MSGGRIITLTTDFGYRDPFAGEMKGVILTINPAAAIVDITHGIEPHAIEQGAFVIGASYRYFPKGTIHTVVVDPGVGSERRALAIEADGYYFVGPDNGVFSYVIEFSKEVKVVHIREEKYVLSLESPTFQGRDVFAPVAAWLSRGVDIGELGPRIKDIERMEVLVPETDGGTISGAVIYIDGFGNAITNIRGSDLARFDRQYKVEARGRSIPFLHHYSEAEDAGLSCLINSSGFLELFVRQGSAAKMFGIAKGEKIVVSGN